MNVSADIRPNGQNNLSSDEKEGGRPMRLFSGRNRFLLWLLPGLLALTLLGGLAFYRPFDSEANGTPLDGTASVPETTPPPPLPVKRTTFLVMGVDRRPDDTGRADSMMVISFDPTSQQLSAVSLPRDTWTEIPGHGFDKINHSFAFGGNKLALATAQRLLGIPIDHYLTVTFQDFAKIVDAIGGVDVDAEKRMLYTDPSDLSMGPDGLVIDIQPGLQHMDGLTALKYSRYRMDDEGDVGRVRRQQQVARDLMKTASRGSILARLPQLIPALSDAIDTDLTVADMLKLGLSGKEAIGNPLTTGVFAGEDKVIGGIFYLIPDLVAQRSAAYEVLVGSKPTDDFLQRARTDQEVFGKALAEALEHDRQMAAEADAQGQAGSGTGAGGVQSGSGGAQGGTGSGSGSGGSQPTKPGTVKPQPITVAVIDASGKNISADWVRKLRSAGFRVARVSKASKPVARTVAIDHAGQPDTEKRIKAVLPTALVAVNLDKTAEEAVEIVLGQDLVPKR
jgi:polyisoprenyl-teichoic acid--peptidoglycan teichoic acid transferase